MHHLHFRDDSPGESGKKKSKKLFRAKEAVEQVLESDPEEEIRPRNKKRRRVEQSSGEEEEGGGEGEGGVSSEDEERSLAQVKSRLKGTRAFPSLFHTVCASCIP